VDEKFSEPLALIDLFGFKGEKTSSSSTYMGNLKKRENIRISIYLFILEHYEKALTKVWEAYPTKVNKETFLFIIMNSFIFLRIK
jgi:hypothetical protein